MKSLKYFFLFGLAILAGVTAHAQGTAFTYQGQLNTSNGLAVGSYDFTFTLFTTNNSGMAVAGPLTNDSVNVSNGLFTVVIDFGSNVFTGTNYWLEIGVESNGVSGFVTLAPRQQLTPVPYSIFAETASNLSGSLPVAQLSGTLANSQLASNSITISAGTGLSGGGTVALGGSTTLSNAGVLSVTGNSDITATNSDGAVTLDDTATNTDTPNTIVKRDGTGSFQADNVGLDGVLNLPATPYVYAGANTLLYADANNNFFAGPAAGVTPQTGAANTAVGVDALGNNQGASDNTAVGFQALFNNAPPGGNFNTAVGYVALQKNTGGNDTACGAFALQANTTGHENTATGYRALLMNTTGVNDTADGAFALVANTIGIQDTAVGEDALAVNVNGNANTAIGFQALNVNVGGNNNIAVGNNAGNVIVNSGNIDIGNTGVAADIATIRIGTAQTTAFMAGIWGAPVPNPAMNVYVNAAGELGTAPSSERFKTNINPMGDASDILLALHPVKFDYKPEFDPSGTPQFGLIAEQVEKVDPDLVVHDQHGIYGVRYDAVNAMLLNEFLKQHDTVEKQNAEIQELQQSVAELKQLVQSLSKNR